MRATGWERIDPPPQSYGEARWGDREKIGREKTEDGRLMTEDR